MGFGRGKGFSPVAPKVEQTLYCIRYADDCVKVHGADGQSFESVRTQANATHVESSGLAGTGRWAISPWPYWQWRVYRGAVWFDTSTLPPGITLKSAKIVLRSDPDTMFADPANTYLYVIDPEGDLADSGLVAADYGELLDNTTPFSAGRVGTGWYPPAADHDLELNAAGLAHINLSGLTCFAFRTNKDIDAIGDLSQHRFSWYSTDFKAERARLVVEWVF